MVESALIKLFVVVGGGFDPFSSAVSLEKNVTEFAEIAKNQGIAPDQVSLLFGAGNRMDELDIAEQASDLKDDDILFAALFGSPRGVDLKLRHNKISGLASSASREDVSKKLQELQQNTNLKNSLRFYYSGHGGAGHVTRGDFHANTLSLWDNNELSVQDFTQLLDGFIPELPMQTLMVQCYSGGFAKLAYRGGKAHVGRQFTDANRCGFFSQVPEREAAGCSPDIFKREEYSTYFFQAYQGKDGEGNKINADFDKNGKVGAHEAHAWVIMNENSFDIPVSTSSEVLRTELKSSSVLKEALTGAQYLESMRTDEKAVALGVSKRLGFAFELEKDPLKKIRSNVATLNKLMSDLDKEMIVDQKILENVLSEIKRSLEKKYPFFLSILSIHNGPNFFPTPEKVESAKKDFVAHPKKGEAMRLAKLIGDKGEAKQVKERTRVKWERLHYLLETKHLEKQFERKDPKILKIKQFYERLKSCEKESFF